MKNRSKALVLCICTLALIVSGVFTTLAYFTSKTDVVTNTFTVGNVKITLDEAKVNAYGVPVDATDTETTVDEAPRVKANTYKLIPGHEYTKDPTVHVDANSEECWVFVKVDNGIANIEDDTKIVAQMATNGWTPVTEGSNIYAHADKHKANDDVVVFNTFTLTGEANVADYAEVNITVTAYAIQADGFDTAAAAWTAAGNSFN